MNYLISEEWKCRVCGFVVWRPRTEQDKKKMAVEFRHHHPADRRRIDEVPHCVGMIKRTGSDACGWKNTSDDPEQGRVKQKHKASRISKERWQAIKDGLK